MDNTILFDKASELLKQSASDENKQIASILISKCIEHSEFDINDFKGTEKPFSELTFDSEENAVIASDKQSMIVVRSSVKMNDDKKPSFQYKRVIPDISKSKALKLTDNAMLRFKIVNAMVQKFITDKEQYIPISVKGDLSTSINNAIKMWQFGTDGWKQGSNRALVKTKENKTIVLMPAILK